MSSHFLQEPVAEKSWFSSRTLKVMSLSKRSVLEWVEFFVAAKTEAQTKLLGVSKLDINSQLDFVEQAQNFSTPAKAAGFKLESYDYEEAGGATFSPFLRELDLAMHQAWREESVLPEEILDHLEKLREAMDKVLESVHKNHLESLEHYQEIAGDFEKVKVWQEHMDRRIGPCCHQGT